MEQSFLIIAYEVTTECNQWLGNLYEIPGRRKANNTARISRLLFPAIISEACSDLLVTARTPFRDCDPRSTHLFGQRPTRGHVDGALLVGTTQHGLVSYPWEMLCVQEPPERQGLFLVFDRCTIGFVDLSSLIVEQGLLCHIVRNKDCLCSSSGSHGVSLSRSKPPHGFDKAHFSSHNIY